MVSRPFSPLPSVSGCMILDQCFFFNFNLETLQVLRIVRIHAVADKNRLRYPSGWEWDSMYGYNNTSGVALKETRIRAVTMPIALAHMSRYHYHGRPAVWLLLLRTREIHQRKPLHFSDPHKHLVMSLMSDGSVGVSLPAT